MKDSVYCNYNRTSVEFSGVDILVLLALFTVQGN